MSTDNCPECKNPIQAGWAYCDNCGRSLISAPVDLAQSEDEANPVPPPLDANTQTNQGFWKCPSCGTDNAPDAPSCKHCGLPLQATSPEHQPIIGRNCPQCGLNNPLEATFCGECGAPLKPIPDSENTPPSIPTPELAPYLEADQSMTGLPAGSLVIQSNNIYLPLPQGKTDAIIGREDPASNIYPEIDLEPHGGHEAGVGRQHARLVMNVGQLCLIDLNSVNGSYINRKKITPDQPHPIQDGDKIRLGRIKLIYRAG